MNESLTKKTRWTINRFLLVAACLAGSAQVAIAGDPGLDTRPSNTTCLAVAPPAQADIVLEQRFAQLGLGGAGPLTILLQPAGDSSWWYFTTRNGRIGRFQNDPDVNSWQTVLDLVDPVIVPPDGGLVGMVFHPDFPADPRVFLNYSVAAADGVSDADIIISSIESPDGGATLDQTTEQVLLRWPRGRFHQGGFMAFDNEGYLLYALGDGTSQGDLNNNSQNLFQYLGKVHRIDVDSSDPPLPYAIPDGNPFSGNGGTALEEIYAFGLRNPYGGDYDPVSENMYVGDVGWTQREEVSKITAGANLGWKIKEGTLCRGGSLCDDPTLIDPLTEFPHTDGKCAVIGGRFYRGSLIPELQGTFLYADFCTGMIAAVELDGAGQPFELVLIPEGQGAGNVHGWGKDNSGEVYVLNNTRIFQVMPNESTNGPPGPPALLSQTGCFDQNDPSIPAPGLVPFEVGAELWFDGVSKRRWISLPDGATISIDADGDFEFPEGTVLLKEFSLDGEIVETRLLQQFQGAWTGFSYEWTGNDAVLLADSKRKALPNGQIYHFPGRGECLRCHTSAAKFSLGPSIEQLNGNMLYPSTNRIANQLETLEQIGMLSGPLPAPVDQLPAVAGLDDVHQAVSRRARSYLHANCAGCHRGEGPTQSTMDLRFATARQNMAACGVAPSFGDLGIPGAQILQPGDPGGSLISVLPSSADPLVRMPPLATLVPHDAAILLLNEWISSPTVCDPPVDSDNDTVTDDADNCPSVANRSQRDIDRDGAGDACDMDTDNDGLDDDEEIALGSDPNDPDTDDDGLNDGAEVTAGTDLLNPDTDGDGFTDGEEVAAGSDPLDPGDVPTPGDPDLVGWYRFDSDNGGTITDSSGNGNDGSCTPASTCPLYAANDGQPAGAYDFVGGGKYVDLANESAFDFTTNFTVAMWIKAANLGTTWAQLVGKGDSAWSVDRTRSENHVQFTTWAPGVDELVGQTDVADNQWHHIAIVYDGSSKILYVDGDVDAQKPYTATTRTNDVAVRFGQNTEYPSAQYDGLLDDVRIYKRALTPAQIAGLMSVGTPPSAVITAPLDNEPFRAGDIVTFTGVGQDPEDGNLPATAMTWELFFHHNGQTDNVDTFGNVSAGSFQVPVSGLDSLGDISYEIRLTVVDSDGLTDTVSHFLQPVRAQITLDTSPGGLDLTFDGSPVTAPFVFDGLVGHEYEIGAVDSASGNQLFVFASWSDGGSRTHTISPPDSPDVLVATFDVSPLYPSGDQDGDGLLNGWEIQFGLDPFDPSDAGLDGDGDDLTNLEEQAAGTDPTNPDTDGDFASDGDEIAAGTDPLDPDSTPELNDPDLVGWYQFDADNSGLIADSSGRGNHGVCSVGITCPNFDASDGRPANSMLFSGSGDFIELGNEGQFDFTSNFTVTLWMRADDLGSTWAQLIGKGDSSWSLDRARNSSRLQFTTWAPGVDELVSQTDISDDLWHHIAIVYDGSRKLIYIDGSVDAQKDYTATVNTNDINVHLGLNAEFPSGQYDGRLDDVRLYSGALSASEVLQVFAEGQP